jgi:FkbM family methyltransferase
MLKREAADLRLLRTVLSRWPWSRGRGALLRLAWSGMRRRHPTFQIAPGISIPAELDDYMVLWAFLRENEQDPAFRLSLSLLRKNDTVVDVGANVGLWSLAASTLVGRHGRVLSFEPLPSTFNRLERNVRLNALHNISCERIALGSEAGSATLFAPTMGNSGAASFGRRPGVDAPEVVAITTLDAYLEENRVESVRFMKIDVEGAELSVFNGAATLLSSSSAPAIVVEVGPVLAGNCGSSPRRVRQCLDGFRYRLFVYEGGKLQPYADRHEETDVDVFAFKDLHLEQFAAELRAWGLIGV